MKYTYFLLASILVLTSCKEEEIIIDPNPSGPSLSCKIDGVDFEDNYPEIEISPQNIISISSEYVVEDLTYTLVINISSIPISSITEGQTIYFSSGGMGVVSIDGSTYSNTYNGPPYDGQIVFTTLEDETLSGTFSFKAKDIAPGMFTNIWVTEGVFENISY